MMSPSPWMPETSLGGKDEIFIKLGEGETLPPGRRLFI